jgi:hypothetical protein
LEAAGQRVRSQLLEMLRRRVPVVDESPTLTRMFMFVEHVKSLLLWHFLKLPAKIWKSNQARFGWLVVGVAGGIIVVVVGGWCVGAGAGWCWCWFQEHTRFPHKAALLCRAFNAEYRLACLGFIHVPIDQLDIGFSLELKHMMEAAGATESA